MRLGLILASFGGIVIVGSMISTFWTDFFYNNIPLLFAVGFAPLFVSIFDSDSWWSLVFVVIVGILIFWGVGSLEAHGKKKAHDGVKWVMEDPIDGKWCYTDVKAGKRYCFQAELVPR